MTDPMEGTTVGENGTEFIVPRSWIDYMGFGASFLCAIHCLLTPILVLTLPVIGSYFVYSHEVEILFIIGSILLAFFSVCWGYRLHKKNQLFLFLFIATTFLLSGIYFYHGTVKGFVLLGLGGLIMATTHFLNLKLCQSCHSCED